MPPPNAVRGLYLLTAKPMIYAANVAEDDLAGGAPNNPHVAALRAKAAEEGSDVVVMSAQVEAELKGLDPEEAAEYLSDLGVAEGGLGALIRATYSQLGLRTYFTTGVKETRAWTISAGMTAPQAAGVIHTGAWGVRGAGGGRGGGSCGVLGGLAAMPPPAQAARLAC
jgi:ribosome-binding ATPase YchF (GTP1/OBG family)